MPHLLIDLDGVIYDGNRSVEGAARTVGWLREQSIPLLFVTNTTSRTRAALAEKLAAMHIAVEQSDILTPPVAANRWLGRQLNGPAALFVPDDTVSEFDGICVAEPHEQDRVGAVVVGDYAERWSFAELNRAFRLLMVEPQPMLVALGMTRYWRAPDGLRLDTAPFVVALSHASGVDPIVLGKPAEPFYAAALSQLGAAADDTYMIGDDIRSDVDGAQRAGIRGLLVRTGKFRANDLELGITPHATLDSIADLPGWWQQRH